METPHVFRFGPFSLDTEARELCKHGTRIKLRGQPYLILEVLLARAGKVVTREEIREKLWPADTFVDFEHGLNTSVKKLREALCDSVDEPRYIETVPRLGYRFIAPLDGLDEKPLPDLQGETVPKPHTLPRLRLSVVVAAMVLVVVTVGYVLRIRSSGLTEKDTVVIADFSNSTGDPVFDDTLKTALTISLRQSPFLNVLGEDKVTATLQLMARPANNPLTSDVTREVCQRAGSKAYIAGSIASLGSQYVLGLKAVNCESGGTLAQEQATAAAKEKVLDALGGTATKLRGELGESLATVQKFDVPLAEATTSSLEALKAYGLGEKALNESGAAIALPHHQRAIELDPNFAMAHEGVAYDYFSLGQLGRASVFFTKAFELREHVSERERLDITASYYANVTGEIDRAVRAYQEAIQSYPLEQRAHIELGNQYTTLGQWEKAREAYIESLRLAPGSARAYGDLLNSLLALQHFEEARHAVQQAELQKVDNGVVRDALYALAFLASDFQAMAEQQQWFGGRPEEDAGLSLASDTEAYFGHLHKARELTKQSIDSSVRADSKETGAIWQEIAAKREAALGNTAEAKFAAAEGLKLYPQTESLGVEVEAALAFAMAGDTAQAESLSENLNKRFPLDTQVQSLWLPAIQAQLALDRKNPAEAIRDLQAAAAPIELGQIGFVNNISCLYHTYIRGEAYLAAGQGTQAAAEFQKILDHSGIVWNCWTGALAQLGVARANAFQAKTSQGANADAARLRALVAYKDFLNHLERRRLRHPHPETSQSRVREAPVAVAGNFLDLQSTVVISRNLGPPERLDSGEHPRE